MIISSNCFFVFRKETKDDRIKKNKSKGPTILSNAVSQEMDFKDRHSSNKKYFAVVI